VSKGQKAPEIGFQFGGEDRTTKTFDGRHGLRQQTSMAVGTRWDISVGHAENALEERFEPGARCPLRDFGR
jgi:hypothetical protein